MNGVNISETGQLAREMAMEAPSPARTLVPKGPNDGTRVRHMTEGLIASLIHQHVSDWLERRALTDAIDAMPDAALPAIPGPIGVMVDMVTADNERLEADNARLTEQVRLADAAAASMVGRAEEALSLLAQMVGEPRWPIPANGPARTFLGYADTHAAEGDGR